MSQKGKNKKWRSAGLYALLAIVLISLATTFLGTRPAERLEISYSDLISRVERGEVSKVLVETAPDVEKCVETETVVCIFLKFPLTLDDPRTSPQTQAMSPTQGIPLTGHWIPASYTSFQRTLGCGKENQMRAFNLMGSLLGRR